MRRDIPPPRIVGLVDSRRHTFIRAAKMPELDKTLASFRRLRSVFLLSDPFCDREFIHLKLDGYPPFLFRAGRLGNLRRMLIEFAGSNRYCSLLPSLHWQQDGQINWAWVKF